MYSLGDLIKDKANKNREKLFLLYKDQKISYQAMCDRVVSVVNGLLDLGIKPKDGIAVMIPNSPEFLYAFFATQMIGAYCVPINTALKGEGLSYIINHSDVMGVIFNHQYSDQINLVRNRLKNVRHFIVDLGDMKDDSNQNEFIFEKLFNSSKEYPNISIDGDSISIIVYTSGTTGLPKGVVKRYNEFDWKMLEERTKCEPNEVLYTCLPLFHVNALRLTVLKGLLGDGVVAISEKFSASRFWDDIRKYQVTTFNAMGAMIPILMKQPEKPDDSENTVEIVVSAACPPSYIKPFEKRFNLIVYNGYSMTEGLFIRNMAEGPVNSMGKPAPYCEVKVVDENDNEVEPGVVGELIGRSKNPKENLLEYYKDPVETAKKTRGGWLHTGDLVYKDNDGWLYFVDRKDDYIRRRGENISCYQVENAINSHPLVLDSAVIAVPSDLGEDEVMAYIVLKQNESLSQEDLLKYCDDKIADFMMPRFIEYIDVIPRNATQKIIKSELKKRGINEKTWDREKNK